MAPTFVTLLVATQHMLRYEWNTETSPNPILELTQNRLMGDAAAGPLKAKLSKVYTTVEWNNLISDPDLSVFMLAYDGASTVVPSYAYKGGAPNYIELSVNETDEKILFELRFNHSIEK